MNFNIIDSSKKLIHFHLQIISAIQCNLPEYFPFKIHIKECIDKYHQMMGVAAPRYHMLKDYYEYYKKMKTVVFLYESEKWPYPKEPYKFSKEDH